MKLMRRWVGGGYWRIRLESVPTTRDWRRRIVGLN